MAWASGTKRRESVVLTDTLLSDFAPDEVEAIFLHEVGHLALGHVVTRQRRLLALFAIGVAGLVFLQAANPATLCALYVLILGFALPSRFQRQEAAADRFAAERMGEGHTLARALRHLQVALGLSDRGNEARSGSTHPLFSERVRALTDGTTVPVPPRWSILGTGATGGLLLVAAIKVTAPTALSAETGAAALGVFVLSEVLGAAERKPPRPVEVPEAGDADLTRASAGR